MKKKIVSILVFVIFIFSMIGCVTVRPRHAPPPRRVVVKKARPGNNYVHVQGHWVWRNGKYRWVNGYWIKKKRGRTWAGGHWVKRGGNWYWVKGHWR